MMTFLSKVVEDPQSLPAMMLSRGNARQLAYDISSKKGRIMESSSSSCSSGVALPSSSAKSEEEKSEDDRFGVSVIRQEYHGYGNLSSSSTDGSSGGVGACGGGGGVFAPPMNGGDGVSWSYFDDLEMDRQTPAPYPFSLLDGRF